MVQARRKGALSRPPWATCRATSHSCLCIGGGVGLVDSAREENKARAVVQRSESRLLTPNKGDRGLRASLCSTPPFALAVLALIGARPSESPGVSPCLSGSSSRRLR